MQPFPIAPLSDFSRAESRAAMKAALEQVGRQLGGDYPLVIDGHPVSPGGWIESLDPSHKTRVVGRCARATPANAEAAVAAALKAFPAWRETEPSRRAQYLFDAANVLRRRRFEMAAWQV